MEQTFLESLKGLEGSAVKGTNEQTYLSFEFGGTIKMERGAFSMVIHFYAKVYETKHKGVIGLDDWDVNDTSDYMLNGLPIDNLTAFRQKLTDWGVGSIGSKLQFTTAEEKIAIANVMMQSDALKKVYGKKLKVWETLSTDEQMLLDLQYIVENFGVINDNLKLQVARFFNIEVVNNVCPTLELYQAKLTELTK
jgi:hypothetical protein